MNDNELKPARKRYKIPEGKRGQTFRLKKIDIAIIGMACRFPGASNYEEFWELLKNGKSCIQEIPAYRWDWRKYWGDPLTEENKCNSKWGGFIKNIRAFDPGFFNFSVREVESMDPQQRIMLELSWACLEDAGIRPSSLSGQKVGVFIGSAILDYKELQEKSQSIESHYATGSAHSVITSRISYYYNFKGPSIPYDTACSSALFAIHSAIQSIQLGECAMALTGGVNLLLTPPRFISFAKMGLLSPTGSCKTFDENADGIVRGEGAGLLLLKPLDKAIDDGDYIYGILKGSAINHSGKTYTLTYPNPEAQAEVITKAFKNANITPDSVGYIEAHGTGTPKGDPLEIKGLLRAFQEFSGKDGQKLKKGFCGLSSVKTNFGHLESAAGIASVIKVLLAMKHKQIPGLHNFKRLNHRISIEDSPFYIVDHLEDWTPFLGEGNKPLPRRAGISAFGFAGTNAHLVLEEFPDNQVRPDSIQKYAYLICLSAKTEEALWQKEYELRLWLENKGRRKNDLVDISATLLLGREHFKLRAAYVVSDIKELREKLKQVLEEGRAEGYLRTDYSNTEELRPDLVLEGQQLLKKIRSNSISQPAYRKNLLSLADLYVKGYDFEWKILFTDKKIHRANLPTYPFARELYWVPEDIIDKSVIKTPDNPSFIHPLLHQSTTNLYEYRYSSNFTGKEFLFADHIVNGQRMLPRVACLEMARVAVKQGIESYLQGQTGIQLKNINWLRSITASDKLIVHIRLFLEENDEIVYEIYSKSKDINAEPIIYCQGIAALCPAVKPQSLDLKGIQTQCNQGVISSGRYYEAFQRIGVNYGPGLRGIEEIYLGNGRILAKLMLPSSVSNTKNQFILHPSLMDSALQAAASLINMQDITVSQINLQPFLPIVLKELEIFSNCDSSMWALIRYSDDRAETTYDKDQAGYKTYELDIDLCSEQGVVCVRMKALSLVVCEEDASPSLSLNFGTLIAYPYWKEEPISQNFAVSSFTRHLVILCEPGEVSKDGIERKLPGASLLILRSEDDNIENRFQRYAVRIFEEMQSILKDPPKDKALIQVVVPMNSGKQIFSGLAGLLKTAHLENPKIIGQMILIDAEEVFKEIAGILEENSRFSFANLVRYRQGKRMVADWKEIEASLEGPSLGEARIPWKDKGVYIITGGVGGLGLIFAKEIGQKVKDVSLILTGRSMLSQEKEAQLQELRASGVKAEYKQVDVTHRRAVDELIQSISSKFGRLNGIIHCAGIHHDNFIIKKSEEEFRKVLAPKVSGIVNLDESSKNLKLDFFIFFSSVAGVFGNQGQVDYATANSFLDAFAEYRNDLVARRERQGQTLSIDWPLWKEGGMRVDTETEKMLQQNMGMTAMQTQTGINALYQGFASGIDQLMVMEGNLLKIKEYLKPNLNAISQLDNISATQIDPEILKEKTVHQLKVLLGEVAELEIEKIDAVEPLESYCIDSLMITKLNFKLAGNFRELSKTLFFEYRNLKDLAEFLVTEYPEECRNWSGLEPFEDQFSRLTSLKVKTKNTRKITTAGTITKSTGINNKNEPIAIIGICGRYPQAKNLKEFWENLKTGRDCITEIPDERWRLEGFFNPNLQEAIAQGKSYGKWGGFVDGFADFDPIFFNISPRDALNMDPQERLFIESCWEVLEDAGYTREQLAAKHHNRVGVFVGVTKTGFDLYGPDLWRNGEKLFPRTSFASMANRISYILNLNGPSMPLDTMCSASLTAIHEACEHLWRGECEMAISGGVNLYLHPSTYVFLCAHKTLSSDGRCKSFGKGGNGFVPGEGVGAILLKPLSRAIADEDHIYALIRGTGINHGGKTNGYTVPNPTAQGELIKTVLHKADVNARAISYIEAHGSGTELGDPIEITGLTQAFRHDTEDTRFCAIGSVKSNIGHLEGAGGIAAVTKIVLQMKHGKIAPSLHSKELNPNINFTKTPFVVQQELGEWKRPVIDGQEIPRIAGVSSYGIAGSNAHVVLEEYIPNRERPHIKVDAENPVVIVLSAKSGERLKEQARRLLAAIDEKQILDTDLANGYLADSRLLADSHLLSDIAYTLQVGREAMEERMAVIVCSMGELVEKLKGFVEEQKGVGDLFIGQVKQNKEMLANLAADQEMQETIEKWIGHRKYKQLLDLWVRGLSLDWNRFYRDIKPCRISLPAYPYDKERYWLPQTVIQSEPGLSDASTQVAAVFSDTHTLHPLIHQNTPDLSTEGFNSNLHESAKAKEKNYIPGQSPREYFLNLVRQILGNAIGLSPERFQTDTPFEKYGIDSVIQMNLIIPELEKITGELSKTLLFEYSNGDELVDYLVENHADKLPKSEIQTREFDKNVISGEISSVPLPSKDYGNSSFHNKPRFMPLADAEQISRNEVLVNQEAEDIAIIGVSGRYPMSNTLEELWEHLKSGDNCITQASQDRWRETLAQVLSGEQLPHLDKKYYGGFLEGIHRFDYQLFDIAKDEVLNTPPELRLFLEIVWETFEDAGYTKLTLHELQNQYQIGVGVFVATMYNHYPWSIPSLESALLRSNITEWQIPNRTSHFFNLTGPSIAINTACSGSLTAIHLACESLKLKDCSMAIAGGINLTLDLSKYDWLQRDNYLGSGALSKSFGAGDGYIPGEGVGAVLLKPLSMAITDHDRIYAVIKSSFVNHGGGRQMYTAPDPKQQAQLIINSIKRSGIDPETIGYVESAANGSELGDPLEVLALTKAFGQFTAKKQYCALGSVKSNIGNLEAASGISQLSKALLQLKHKTLAPTINSSPRNKNIKLENSAFYLQEQTAPWEQFEDSHGNTLPRRSIINSFGLGGAYANLIIEEYMEEVPTEINRCEQSNTEKSLIIFSAKTEWSLFQYLEKMQCFLEKNLNISIDDIAQSLLKINHALECRAALIVSTTAELLDKIMQLQKTKKSVVDAQIYLSSDLKSEDDAMDLSIEKAVENKDLKQLALLWTSGANIDFRPLYNTVRPSLISLPKYAFEHDIEFRFNQNKAMANTIMDLLDDEYYRGIIERTLKGELSEEEFMELMSK